MRGVAGALLTNAIGSMRAGIPVRPSRLVGTRLASYTVTSTSGLGPASQRPPGSPETSCVSV